MAMSVRPLSEAVGTFYVLLVLDPNQQVPSYFGWAPLLSDAQDTADEHLAKNPRLRAVILESFEFVNAVASLRSVNIKTGEERKRPVPEAVRIA